MKNAELEELFKSPGNITVFAPTDKAKIFQILNGHVVSEKLFVKDTLLTIEEKDGATIVVKNI